VTNGEKYTKQQRSFLRFINLSLILLMLIGCGGPSAEELAAVDYMPLPGSDWEVSTPEEQGLDPLLVAELYYNAEQLETLYGLLVVKNGNLVAEKYFHGKSKAPVGFSWLVPTAVAATDAPLISSVGCPNLSAAPVLDLTNPSF
jgi:hypothetical protein